MTASVQRYTKDLVERRGWRAGSSLENRFALRLSRLGVTPADLVQQHPVGSYKIDFADPDVRLGIEADGFYHRMPGAAERDHKRDAWLLTQGWYVFRIDDACDDGQLERRLCAAVLLIREERTYQGLPWKRHEPTRKKTEPSRLAKALGCPPLGAEVASTAHTRWAKTPDRSAATEPARRGLQAKFEREVDPDGVLPPAQRAVLAESARKAYYLRLSLAAAKARRLRKAA